MSGALDVAGFKKDLFYFYQSQWIKEPMVHILPHWTHPLTDIGTMIPIWVYSNCDEVELFLNGNSLGKDKPGTKWDEMQCEWMVPYEKGTLTAKGYRNGKIVAETHQITAAQPSTFKLSLDDKYVNPDNDNIAIVTASICDSNGTIYPYGENTMNYKINGGAHIISLENGAPVDTTKNYGIFEKRAFMGLTNAFIELDTTKQPVTLMAGAILGEKQLLTSNLVSIDVENIALRGKLKEQSFEIFYTTNDSIPTKNSIKYSCPFIVQQGTTVKAIVVQGNETLLTMQETFEKGLGLYWGTDKETKKNEFLGTRAVDAEHKGAVVVQINNQNCLTFSEREGMVRWYQENDGSAGIFTLTFLYTCKTKDTDCPMELYVNNNKTGELIFKTNDTKQNKWSEVSIRQHLKAGANYIELRTSIKKSLNIFKLQIE
jgi:beta-galactosidase